MKSLRQIRIKKGISRQTIATALGINLSNLSPIEAGKQIPTLLTRTRLELFLGTKVNWLKTPRLLTAPPNPTNWISCEREFRRLYRLVNGLPNNERNAFIITAIKQLRKLKIKAE